jgi:hypothetical protein
MSSAWMNLADLHPARLDAAFYDESAVESERLLQAAPVEMQSLGEISKRIFKGAFSVLQREYASVGVPFLRTAEIKHGQVNLQRCTFLPPDIDKREERTRVYPGDLVLAKTGASIGYSAAMPPWISAANTCQDLVGVRLAGDQDPYYLQAFLASDAGQAQAKRWGHGNAQPHLGLNGIREWAVPLPSPRLQLAIGNLLRKADTLSFMRSILVTSLRKDVRALLNRWSDFVAAVPDTAPTANSLESSAADVHWGLCATADLHDGDEPSMANSVDADRNRYHTSWVAPSTLQRFLTAQTHRPEIREAIEAVRSCPKWSFLRDLCTSPVGPGKPPAYSASGVPCIKTRHIRKLYVDPRTVEFVTESFALRHPSAQLDYGAILINRSGAGSVGRSGIYLSQRQACVSQEVIQARVSTECGSAYVAAFLSSSWGERALEGGITGSTGQLHLDIPHVAGIGIPLPPLNVQRFIGWKTRLAYRMWEESLSLQGQAGSAIDKILFSSEGLGDEFLLQGAKVEQWLDSNTWQQASGQEND